MDKIKHWYVCKICKRAFMSSPELKIHKKTHRLPQQQRVTPYLCVEPRVKLERCDRELIESMAVKNNNNMLVDLPLQNPTCESLQRNVDPSKSSKDDMVDDIHLTIASESPQLNVNSTILITSTTDDNFPLHIEAPESPQVDVNPTIPRSAINDDIEENVVPVHTEDSDSLQLTVNLRSDTDDDIVANVVPIHTTVASDYQLLNINPRRSAPDDMKEDATLHNATSESSQLCYPTTTDVTAQVQNPSSGNDKVAATQKPESLIKLKRLSVVLYRMPIARELVCNICGEILSSQVGLESHMTAHTIADLLEDSQTRPLKYSDFVTVPPMNTPFVQPPEEWRREKCEMLALPFLTYIKCHDRLTLGEVTGPDCVYPVRPDGRCFYRCVSKILTGSQGHHRKIRLLIAEFFQQHKQFTFGDKDLVEFTKSEDPANWAYAPDYFICVAEWLAVRMYLYNDEQKLWHMFRPLKPSSSDFGIFISCHNVNWENHTPNHFELIKKLNVKLNAV